MTIDRSACLLTVLILASMAAPVEVPARAAPPAGTATEEAAQKDASDQESSKSNSGVAPSDKQKQDDDLDRKLLRDLLPDLPLELGPAGKKSDAATKKPTEPRSKIPFADELDEAVAAMREVSQRLDRLNLSEDTEQLQTGIVTNIDALIEKLKNLPPPSSSSSSDSSDQDQSDSDSTSQGQKSGSQSKPQPTPQQRNGADSAAGGTGQKPKAGKAGESTEQNLREARERAAALARRRALIDEVWGHLPPAMRERLLNVGSEKLLPRYEALIRRYYEALAEPEKTGPRR